MHAMAILLQGAPQGGANPLVNLLPLLGMLAIFYFLLIVPQRRQVKEHQRLVDSLQKGDQVVTAGGLIGEIISIKDDTVQLRTGNSTVVVERARITRRATPAASEK
ncbi:MAG TPA: preprotein translocase subunit YajC [Longimicrobium sp.]|jgi:preprotein translocase subunit YajC